MKNSNLLCLLTFPLKIPHLKATSPVVTIETLSLALVAQKVVLPVVRVGEGRRSNQARLSGVPWSPLGHLLAGQSEPSPSC